VHKGRVVASLDKLQVTKEDVLVVQVFDTSLYMAAPEEGGLIPPVKQLDGSYHIHGDFVMIDKDMQYDFVKQLLTELDKWKEKMVKWATSCRIPAQDPEAPGAGEAAPEEEESTPEDILMATSISLRPEEEQMREPDSATGGAGRAASPVDVLEAEGAVTTKFSGCK
jgi:hypothetical protein